ncbi:hypothetical protein JB92DRAFT_2835836 [Gautieria morchelliformis]|nr:hypothetical protein JB92DRAFT_2835836 [Gautieria morchelliformis]
MYDQGGIDLAALVLMIVQDFPDYYDKLVNSKSVQCLETNHTFEAIRKPTAVVLDQIRSVTRRSIPVLGWGSPYASSTLAVMVLEKFGGFRDVEAKPAGRLKLLEKN